jgi:predicted HNH restriction endonuclease
MPIDRQRYPENWSDIALSVKQAADWRCRHCRKQCLRPGEKPKDFTRSEWTVATLSVHHANFTPEDNRLENLIPLCTPCHLAVHTRCRSNVSPGQLSLFNWFASSD